MTAPASHTPVRWSKVVDQDRCIGCHACTTACKSENEVPLSVTRTYVKSVEVGTFPNVRRNFQVTRCNQCENPPCVAACPTHAMHQRPDGIVDFDKSLCIGCKACIAACPYDAIFINPADHAAEKCNFCAHRLDLGLEPACVVVCPAEALIVGDLNDPNSRVAQIVNRSPVTVRRPEKDTRPKLFYKGAHAATLDPLAATQPTGGLFMFSEQLRVDQYVVSGTPADAERITHNPANTAAAALLSYDVAHKAPWDWRVSLYTWTKSISAGAWLVGAALLLTGQIPADGALWQWIVPVVALMFLGLTGGLLLWDLEHPKRFHLIFIKHQWRSWLVRGAFIISAFGLILVLHVAASLLGHFAWHAVLAWIGIPIALLTAIYTAYLFAQAKARDLWQNPLLPPHMAVQAVLAGAAELWLYEPTVPALPVVLASASALHVLMILGEITLTHPTAHARLAAHIMTHGAFAKFFWPGLGLCIVAVFAPWLSPWIAAPCALIGLLAHEHAYVQAGQRVPLA